MNNLSVNSDIAYLFGAGISIDAGFPSTKCINKAVLEDGIYRHSDGHWLLGTTPSGVSAFEADDVRTLLRFLRSFAADFYQKETDDISYEDLSFLAGQISDCRGNYDNPALAPLIDQIELAVLPHICSAGLLQYLDGGSRPVESLAKHAAVMISHITAAKINEIRDATSPRIIELVQSSSPRFIAVLNHDCLVESSLNNANVPFTEGFESTENGHRYWSSDAFDNKDVLHLYKLHGSVNWHWAEIGNRRKLIAPDRHSQQDWMPISSMDDPHILTGTFNKILEYIREPFIGIFNAFARSLKEVKSLVVSGYSFRDKGVNSIIINWLDEQPDRKLVVIHPNLKNNKEVNEKYGPPLLSQMRQAMRGNWDRWENGSQLIPIENCFEDVAWADITKRLCH